MPATASRSATGSSAAAKAASTSTRKSASSSAANTPPPPTNTANGATPDDDEEFTEEHERGLTFLGIVAIIDPPRAEAAEAIAEAHRAGIRTVMITGDHPVTASRIARDLGITDEEEPAVLTGRELDAFDEAGLRAVGLEVGDLDPLRADGGRVEGDLAGQVVGVRVGEAIVGEGLVAVGGGVADHVERR